MATVLTEVDYENKLPPAEAVGEDDISRLKRDLRPKVADILDIPDVPGWEITDILMTDSGEPGLVLVNAKKDAENQFPLLRGLMVDVEHDFVFGSRGSRPKPIHLDKVQDVKGPVSFVTMEGGQLTLPSLGAVEMTHAFDGPILRVIRWGGITVICSRTRFNLENSRWTQRVMLADGTYVRPNTFLEDFMLGMGENDVEDLFDEDALYSPVIHAFVVNAPDSRVADRYRGGLFLNYLPPMEFWGPEESPYPFNEVDFNVRKPKFMTSELRFNNKEPYVFEDPGMSVAEVNEYLKYSLETDEGQCDDTDHRTWPGGAIVMTLRDQFGRIVDMFNIFSTSWLWRMELRDNRANLELAMYVNLEYLHANLGTPDQLRNREAYAALFPTLLKLPFKEIAELAKAEDVSCWQTVDSPITTDQEMRENALNCELLAAPWHRQPEVLAIRIRILKEEPQVKAWMMRLWKTDRKKLKEELQQYDKPNRKGQQRGVERTMQILRMLDDKTKTISGKEKDARALQLLGANFKTEAGSNMYRISRLYRAHKAKKPVF